MKILTIQPGHPYLVPWHVDETGKVRRQDLWKGDPEAFIGFAPADNVHDIRVLLQDVLAKGTDIINDLIPVFKTSDGDWITVASEDGYIYTINEKDSK